MHPNAPKKNNEGSLCKHTTTYDPYINWYSTKEEAEAIQAEPDLESEIFVRITPGS